MCYHCHYNFTAPVEAASLYDFVVCPHCGETEQRQHYKCDDEDPLRHPLGWPYDDPTIPYDC